jgi:hypothetical protein
MKLPDRAGPSSLKINPLVFLGGISMLLEEDRHTEAGLLQKRRCKIFGSVAAKRIRAARDCQFSLLPQEELARLAVGWYEAAAQATLHGNFSLISEWMKRQTQTSAEQNFELADVLELLRICRTVALHEEKWDADLFLVVDEVINETLQSIRSELPWEIPPKLDYVSASAPASPVAQSVANAVRGAVQAEAKAGPWSQGQSQNRRDFGRNRLKLPIRVVNFNADIREIKLTENISLSGLYFLTRNPSYHAAMAVKVTYPYWTDSGAINVEYAGKVVRIDRRMDGWFGIAVDFHDLSPRPF